MEQLYSWPWVEAQVAQTIDVWNHCAGRIGQRGDLVHLPRYDATEQQQRERAYDEGLTAVERELKLAPRTGAERLRAQGHIIAAFSRFSASALGLEGEMVKMLTDEFMPVGTGLARWARSFDPDLSMPDIIQACRNAWTACGLQPLLGEKVRLTPSILGYSLLYPYSDNYLDRTDKTSEDKLRFSQRFRGILQGELLPMLDRTEASLVALVKLIEGEFPRARYPQVFDCLLAIHRAQEQSIQQLDRSAADAPEGILQMSCAKGGTSVLADACLACGSLSEQESRFAFEWGVLLQLGDDLQDVRDDLRRGSVTLFSRAAAMGVALDGLVIQLLNFSERVATRMDELPHGSDKLKELLRMSWRSLILRAVADSHEYFSAGFLVAAEMSSPFRFEFMRSRNDRLSSRQGMYGKLFEALLEVPERDTASERDGTSAQLGELSSAASH